MTRSSLSRPVFSALLASCALLASAGAQVPDGPQAAFHMDLSKPPTAKAPLTLPSTHFEIDVSNVGRLVMPPLDASALIEEDARDAQFKTDRSLRYGVARDLPLFLANGSWTHVPPNVFHWAVDVESPGAIGIRLRLNLDLPERAFLVVYSPDDPTRIHGPYSADGPFDNGQVWTPTTFGDTVRVELLMATNMPPDDGNTPFIIDKMQHIYRDPVAERAPPPPPEGACHNDVTCYAAWANTASAVNGVGSISGNSLFCTGNLVATQAGDQTPYVLTANHCVGSSGAAQTVEIYWNFQSSTCGGPPPSLASVPQSAVTTMLVTQGGINTTDHTLLMVEGALPGGLGFAGWNAGAVSNGTALTGVHHPDGAYKRISFGNKIAIGDPDKVQVSWFDGPTEPGSSGSGLFLSSNQQLIGTLSTGSSWCGSIGNSFPDQYGAFSVAYPSMSSFLAGGSDDNLEQNDSCAAATTMGDGTSNNLVVKSTDEDWYSLTVPAGNQLNLNLAFTHANGDIDVKLFDGCGGAQLAISETATNNEALTWTNSTGSAKTVKAQVFLYSDTRNDYGMTISGTTGGGGHPNCPGTGDCCADTGTPGCSDGTCCAAVCACDPFCCDTEWDEFCAGEGFQGSGCGAEILCGGCATCGNGVLDPGEECDPPNGVDCDNNCQTINPSGPLNDDCSNALPVGTGTFAFDSTGATTDGPNEPNQCNFFNYTQVGNDVWFAFTAPCTSTATIGLCSSSFDTKVAVYTGGNCPGGSSASACNDDACGGGQNVQSQIIMPVVGGQTYLIRIGGYNGATGQGVLSIATSCSTVCQQDIGSQGPGSATFSACGDALATGGVSTFSLTGAPPNVSAFLVYSFQNTGAAFQGGVLVPFPNYDYIAQQTNASGQIVFDVNGGGGPGTLYAQYAIKVNSTTWWLSNALALQFLP
jgi:hypothetical protein